MIKLFPGFDSQDKEPVTVTRGRLKYLEEVLDLVHKNEFKRAQAIHENNVLRKQIQSIAKQNAHLQLENKAMKDYTAVVNAKGAGIKTAALVALSTGWLERAYKAGGLANVREAIKVHMGFDGLSQIDIDTSI